MYTRGGDVIRLRVRSMCDSKGIGDDGTYMGAALSWI